MALQRQQSDERVDLVVGPLRTDEVDGHACIGAVIVPATPLAVHVAGAHVVLPSTSAIVMHVFVLLLSVSPQWCAHLLYVFVSL